MVTNLPGSQSPVQPSFQKKSGPPGNGQESAQEQQAVNQNLFTERQQLLKQVIFHRPEDTLGAAMDEVLLSNNKEEKENGRLKVAFFLKQLGALTVPKNIKSKDGNPYLIACLKQDEPNLFYQFWRNLENQSQSTIQAKVNEADQYGNTVMDLAALQGKTHLLDTLLEKGGGNLSTEKQEALRNLAKGKKQQREEFQRLLESRAHRAPGKSKFSTANK